MTKSDFQPFEDAPANEVPVRGYLHVPANLADHAIVLTHSAGANCQSSLLVALADSFCKSGLLVLRCDLPFRQLRPHGPPLRGSAERDQQGLRRAVGAVKRKVMGRVFLGGHSYGGRQASMLAGGEPELVHALLLLSYPLHPPKARTQLRTAHFPAIRIPTLFAHGTRDGFGTIDEMNRARKLIPARTRLLPIENAGHELMTPRNRSTLPNIVSGEFVAFVEAHA